MSSDDVSCSLRAAVPEDVNVLDEAVTAAIRKAVTELSSADKLYEFRAKQDLFMGNSFDPIIAYGKHGIRRESRYKSEKDYLNSCHRLVFETISPYLTEEEANWLKRYKSSIAVFKNQVWSLWRIQQFMLLWNFHGEQNTVSEALQLDIPEHAVICITGSGGKTSLMFAWAEELSAAGKKTAVTTTTRMAADSIPADCTFDCFVVPDPEKPGKVSAPDKAAHERIFAEYDVTLIEADGARRLPLKWPADWEPVVPDRTDITVCVAGLSSIGCPASDVTFRSELIPDAIKRDFADEQYIFALLSSPDGGRKAAQGEFRVFLNQADDGEKQASARKIQAMLAMAGIQSAWGSLNSNRSSLHVSSDTATIAVILEAAGKSTRFGSNKLLHIMDDGRPMAACIMDAVSDAEGMLNNPHHQRVSANLRKILVTQYEEVAALAPDFEIVMNDRPDLGISYSMQLGIEAAADADAYMFCVCDQPRLSPGTICRLIQAYKKGTAGIVSLSWQGQMCNPKIFSSVYKNELLSLSGDTGGRQIISAHLDDLLLVGASSEEEVRDIDSM